MDIINGRQTIDNGLTVTSGSILATNFNSDNAVVNTADTYTDTAKITNIITLSQAEYDAIGSPSSNYLYVII
jgi:hypothetical protein